MLGLVLSLAGTAAAQTVSAVPKLDLNRYTGLWYEIAHYPSKFEKRCVGDITVLYALGDKPNTFEMGTFCRVKGGNFDDTDAAGKMDKTADGRLMLRHLVLFWKKYWVLAIDPSYQWALVGSPDHKTLSVLSRNATIAPEVYATLQARASAEGFNVTRLVTVPQHP